MGKNKKSGYSKLISNDKIQMSNQAQNPKSK
jgi:hypothetical protein